MGKNILSNPEFFILQTKRKTPMADLRPTQVPSVTPSLTSDVKRNFNDAMGADLGNAAGFTRTFSIAPCA